MEWSAVGALFAVARSAQEIYAKGFSKAQSAKTQYLAFGTAINALEANLRTLENVVNEASQLPRRSPPNPQTLYSILGDYEKTLRNCNKLLVERSGFVRDNAGFVTNIVWNATIQEEVARLTEQVAFHNTKILLVLQPLELVLLKEIRDLSESIDTRLKRIEESLNVYFRGTSLTEDLRDAEDTAEFFPIAEEVAERFDTALQKQNMRSGNCQITLLNWTDGFVLHYKSGIPTLEMSDYLKLMKCKWIMERIQVEMVSQKMLDPLWKHYVSQLHTVTKLLGACQNLRSTCAPIPDLNAILRLPESEFFILPPDPFEVCSAKVLDESHLTVLLNVVLSDIDQGVFNVRHDLTVLRNLNGSLQLRTTEVTRTNRQTDRLIQTSDVSLEQAHLTPLYASPTASPGLYIVDVNSNFSPSGGLNVTFHKQDDLFRFQELITGYRVVAQRLGIKTLSYIEKAPAYHKGRLQIWTAARSSKKGSESRSCLIRTPSVSPVMSPPLSSSCSPVLDRRPSVATFAPSSGSSKLSQGSGSSQRTTVDLGSGTQGLLLELPKNPVLAFFLCDNEEQSFFFFSVCIDKNTIINRKACKCKDKNDIDCSGSVIERPGGLLARQYHATSGLRNWNLAAIGQHQVEQQPIVSKFRYVKIQFSSVVERTKFTEVFEAVKQCYDKDMDIYNRDYERLISSHIVQQNL